MDRALVSHCLTALIWGSSAFSESSSTRERFARLGVDIRLFNPLLRDDPAVGEEFGPPLPSPLYMRWLMALVAMGGRAPETDLDDRRLPRASRRDVDSIRYRSAGSSYVTGDCRSTPPVSRDMISVGLPKETVAVRERSLGRCPDAGGELGWWSEKGGRVDVEAIQWSKVECKCRGWVSCDDGCVDDEHRVAGRVCVRRWVRQAQSRCCVMGQGRGRKDRQEARLLTRTECREAAVE